MRAIGLAAVGLAAMLGLSMPAAAGELIRIEPRPFYGATVTIERGIRIFRPLPAPSRVIINSGGVPLSLSIVEAPSFDESSGRGLAGLPFDGGDIHHNYGSPPLALPLGFGGRKFRPRKRPRMARDSVRGRRLPTIRKGMTR